ncbi:ABC transporter ATP-binding protein [Bacillus massilinigeriensis]|uniref:ABC transporter ATP-binding protein n=1 Tax=Bacillus mediterraneensis TaxID=1805474 RepID=UPI0008F95E8A|nr:ABC transporter ATP-binding protein [Bacillus mediterraneensis]
MITLKDVLVRKNGKPVLRVSEFTLAQGKICGIMGRNGAGKSTLLKTMALLERPAQGSITFMEEPIKESSLLKIRRQFSVALQQTCLLDGSVFYNVSLGLRLRKVSKKELKEKTMYWLEMFHISHLAKKNALLLSGGEAQRVNLARAMVIEPKLLFLDEPFSSLDFPTKSRLTKELKDILNKTKTTAMLISHDYMEIKYMTDCLAILDSGEIIQFGETADVLNSPNKAASAFLGEWN